jgi:hypothetical protein
VEEYSDRTSALQRERYLESLMGGPEKLQLVASVTAEQLAACQSQFNG